MAVTTLNRALLQNRLQGQDVNDHRIVSCMACKTGNNVALSIWYHRAILIFTSGVWRETWRAQLLVQVCQMRQVAVPEPEEAAEAKAENGQDSDRYANGDQSPIHSVVLFTHPSITHGSAPIFNLTLAKLRRGHIPKHIKS